MGQTFLERSVVDLAYEIIDMYEELSTLKHENKKLKKDVAKYNKIIDDNIKHDNTMMGNLLKATMNMNEEQLKNAFEEKEQKGLKNKP